MTRGRNHVPAHGSIRPLPSLASAHEQKLANFGAPTWFAIFLPRGASEPIIRKLKQQRSRRDTPSVKKRLNVLVLLFTEELISGG